jgi:hypothetical protein
MMNDQEVSNNGIHTYTIGKNKDARSISTWRFLKQGLAFTISPSKP